MSHLLALALRLHPTRRLLARFHWPRPEHIRRLTKSEFLAYMQAIGFLQDVEVALAEYRRERDQTTFATDVRSPEVRADGRQEALA